MHLQSTWWSLEHMKSHDKCICKAHEDSLNAFVRQCAPRSNFVLLFFLFSVSCLLQILMLEWLHFSSTNGSLYYDVRMTLQLGGCESVLLISVLVMCKHLFCNSLWLTVFCVLVLFDIACDKDHKSATNELLYYYY